MAPAWLGCHARAARLSCTFPFALSIHITIISILPVGRWLDHRHFHCCWLSDSGFVVGPCPGSCCFYCHLQQKGHSGNLQPEPAGEGRPLSGDVEPGTAACNGEAGLVASCLQGREPHCEHYSWLECFPDTQAQHPTTGITATPWGDPWATSKAFVNSTHTIVLSYSISQSQNNVLVPVISASPLAKSCPRDQRLPGKSSACHLYSLRLATWGYLSRLPTTWPLHFFFIHTETTEKNRIHFSIFPSSGKRF